MENLLTLILILFISSANSSEQAVYYCNTIQYTVSDSEGIRMSENVSNQKSRIFRLFIDEQQRNIRVSGDKRKDWPGEGLIYVEDPFNWFLNAGHPDDKDKLFFPKYYASENEFLGYIPPSGRPKTIGIMFEFKYGIFSVSMLGTKKTGDPLLTSFIAKCEKF
jgi:hypothetical protein